MNFKTWLEIVEPFKPISVKKKLTSKNKGTNTEKPMLQFQWKTSKGNDVKLQLIPKNSEQTDCEAIFYVNDTLDDNAGGNERDPEILSSVLYVLRKKAETMNIMHLFFQSHSSDNDTKIIRNLPINTHPALTQLDQFENAIKRYTPFFLPHSQKLIDFYAKVNKPLPAQQLSFDRNSWLNWIEALKKNIINPPNHQDGSDIEHFLDALKTGIGTDKFKVLNFDVSILEKTLETLSNEIKSNSEQGWRRTTNRRKEIYHRLIKKYFPDWKITISNNSFYLDKIMPEPNKSLL